MPSYSQAKAQTIITGVGLRLPHADNLEELSKLLLNQCSALGEPRWQPHLFGMDQQCGLVASAGMMDCNLFNISPEEASYCSPVLGPLLEVVTECILDSGLKLSDVAKHRTGFYLGVTSCDTDTVMTGSTDSSSSFLNTRTELCARVAHQFDLRGPVLQLDGANASSFATIHAALMDLKAERCDIAIVAGCNLVLDPIVSFQIAKLNILSPREDSLFDGAAHGYVRSEGIIALLLLSSTADITTRTYCDIVGFGLCCNGAMDNGLLYANHKSQAELLTDVYTKHNIDANDIVYYEAAAASQKGSQAELTAIIESVCKKRHKPLIVGSISGNVGHTEATAGLAGIVKCLASYRTQTIFANVNVNQTDSSISSLKTGNIVIPTSNSPWPEDKTGLMSVSSIGFGGLMGHIVLKPRPTLSNITQTVSQPLLIPLNLHPLVDIKCAKSELEKHVKDLGFCKYLLNSEMCAGNVYPQRSFLVTQPDNGSVLFSQCCNTSMTIKALTVVFTDFLTTPWIPDKRILNLPVIMRSLQLYEMVLTNNVPYHDGLLAALNAEPVPLASQHGGFALRVACQMAVVDVMKQMDVLRHVYTIQGQGIGALAAAYADGCLSGNQCIMVADIIETALISETLRQQDTAVMKVSIDIDEVYQLGPWIRIHKQLSQKEFLISVLQGKRDEVIQTLNEKGHIFEEKEWHTPLYAPLPDTLERNLLKSLRCIIPTPVLWSDRVGILKLKQRGNVKLCDARFLLDMLTTSPDEMDSVESAFSLDTLDKYNMKLQRGSPASFTLLSWHESKESGSSDTNSTSNTASSDTLLNCSTRAACGSLPTDSPRVMKSFEEEAATEDDFSTGPGNDSSGTLLKYPRLAARDSLPNIFSRFKKSMLDKAFHLTGSFALADSDGDDNCTTAATYGSLSGSSRLNSLSSAEEIASVSSLSPHSEVLSESESHQVPPDQQTVVKESNCGFKSSPEQDCMDCLPLTESDVLILSFFAESSSGETKHYPCKGGDKTVRSGMESKDEEYTASNQECGNRIQVPADDISILSAMGHIHVAGYTVRANRQLDGTNGSKGLSSYSGNFPTHLLWAWEHSGQSSEIDWRLKQFVGHPCENYFKTEFPSEEYPHVELPGFGLLTPMFKTVTAFLESELSSGKVLVLNSVKVLEPQYTGLPYSEVDKVCGKVAPQSQKFYIERVGHTILQGHYEVLKKNPYGRSKREHLCCSVAMDCPEELLKNLFIIYKNFFHEIMPFRLVWDPAKHKTVLTDTLRKMKQQRKNVQIPCLVDCYSGIMRCGGFVLQLLTSKPSVAAMKPGKSTASMSNTESSGWKAGYQQDISSHRTDCAFNECLYQQPEEKETYPSSSVGLVDEIKLKDKKVAKQVRFSTDTLEKIGATKESIPLTPAPFLHTSTVLPDLVVGYQSTVGQEAQDGVAEGLREKDAEKLSDTGALSLALAMVHGEGYRFVDCLHIDDNLSSTLMDVLQLFPLGTTLHVYIAPKASPSSESPYVFYMFPNESTAPMTKDEVSVLLKDRGTDLIETCHSVTDALSIVSSFVDELHSLYVARVYAVTPIEEEEDSVPVRSWEPVLLAKEMEMLFKIRSGIDISDSRSAFAFPDRTGSESKETDLSAFSQVSEKGYCSVLDQEELNVKSTKCQRKRNTSFCLSIDDALEQSLSRLVTISGRVIAYVEPLTAEEEIVARTSRSVSLSEETAKTGRKYPRHDHNKVSRLDGGPSLLNTKKMNKFQMKLSHLEGRGNLLDTSDSNVDQKMRECSRYMISMDGRNVEEENGIVKIPVYLYSQLDRSVTKMGSVDELVTFLKAQHSDLDQTHEILAHRFDEDSSFDEMIFSFWNSGPGSLDSKLSANGKQDSANKTVSELLLTESAMTGQTSSTYRNISRIFTDTSESLLTPFSIPEIVVTPSDDEAVFLWEAGDMKARENNNSLRDSESMLLKVPLELDKNCLKAVYPTEDTSVSYESKTEVHHPEQEAQRDKLLDSFTSESKQSDNNESESLESFKSPCGSDEDYSIEIIELKDPPSYVASPNSSEETSGDREVSEILRNPPSGSHSEDSSNSTTSSSEASTDTDSSSAYATCSSTDTTSSSSDTTSSSSKLSPVPLLTDKYSRKAVKVPALQIAMNGSTGTSYRLASKVEMALVVHLSDRHTPLGQQRGRTTGNLLMYIAKEDDDEEGSKTSLGFVLIDEHTLHHAHFDLKRRLTFNHLENSLNILVAMYILEELGRITDISSKEKTVFIQAPIYRDSAVLMLLASNLKCKTVITSSSLAWVREDLESLMPNAIVLSEPASRFSVLPLTEGRGCDVVVMFQQHGVEEHLELVATSGSLVLCGNIDSCQDIGMACFLRNISIHSLDTLHVIQHYMTLGDDEHWKFEKNFTEHLMELNDMITEEFPPEDKGCFYSVLGRLKQIPTEGCPDEEDLIQTFMSKTQTSSQVISSVDQKKRNTLKYLHDIMLQCFTEDQVVALPISDATSLHLSNGFPPQEDSPMHFKPQHCDETWRQMTNSNTCSLLESEM